MSLFEVMKYENSVSFYFFQSLYTESFYEYFKTLEKESQSYSVDEKKFEVCFVPYSKKKKIKIIL